MKRQQTYMATTIPLCIDKSPYKGVLLKQHVQILLQRVFVESGSDPCPTPPGVRTDVF